MRALAQEATGLAGWLAAALGFPGSEVTELI